MLWKVFWKLYITMKGTQRVLELSSRSARRVLEHSMSIRRALWEHLKKQWNNKSKIKSTWALKVLKTLGLLRHSGTLRAPGCPGTWQLRHSNDTWTLMHLRCSDTLALEGRFLADLKNLWKKLKKLIKGINDKRPEGFGEKFQER